ncbi:MAG: hypothetical protein WC725_00015 [Patescibacteria group bacterium]|jgi:hypothetical protein
MFWSKSKKTVEESEIDQKLTVYTIPDEFYGGGNPVIKFRNVEKSFGPAPAAAVVPPSKVLSLAPKPIMPSVAVSAKTAVGFFGNWKLMALAAASLFILFLGGSGFYYWRTMRAVPPKVPAKQVETVKQNPVPIVVPELIPTTTPEVASSTEQEPAVSSTTTQALDGGALEFPSILLGNSADLDQDGLTDTEEELFKTDPSKADSDADGYEDGTEIFYLYSPSVVAPTRLITTDAVKEFLNPRFNYKIYYPTSWAIGNVDPDYRDVLFSTITGENVEVRVFDKKIGETFDSWFANWAKGEQLGSLKDFMTVFKGPGRARNDNLVYYFEDREKIYVLIYHVIGSGSVNYRDVINMMARSFRLPSESGAVLPEQKVIRETAPGAEVPLVP